MPKKSQSRKKSASGASRWTFDRIPRAWLYAAAALVAAVFLFGNQGFRKAVANTLLLRCIERTDAELTREEARLHKELVAARFDERALEDAARRDLGYLKSGEVEYRFPPPKKEKPGS